MVTRPIPAATEEFFTRFRKLRMDVVPDHEAFAQLRRSLEDMAAQLGAVTNGQTIVFALASLADDRWRWPDTLEYAVFHTDVRATKFYQQLDELLSSSSSDPDAADAVWVFAKALAFGFRGHPPEGKTALKYADACRTFLSRAWGTFPKISRDAEIEGERTLAIRRRRGSLVLILATGLLFLVIAGGLIGLEQARQSSLKWAADTNGALRE